MPALRHHVARIVAIRTGEKMGRVNALRVIATVENELPPRNETVKGLIRIPMSSLVLTTA